MSNHYSGAPATVRISAGTAIKIGFFGALGVTLFSVILSLIGTVIVLLLLAAGFAFTDLIPR